MRWYKNIPYYETYYDLPLKDTPRKKLRYFFAKFVFLTSIILVGYLLLSGINYLDIPNHCYINIKYDVLRGDKKSIVQALKSIKSNDYIAYRNICDYVDTIYERRCVKAENSNPKLSFLNSNGCYIKGTNAILINPLTEHTEESLKRRHESIILYSEMSKDFWNN
ncbi:hypothetical protein ACFL0C_02025 [Patescibacteria group bacterium]